MDRRTQMIDAIALAIVECELDLDAARQVNQDGWAIDLGNGRNDGGWLRYEGVMLSTAELDRAWRTAHAWQQGGPQ